MGDQHPYWKLTKFIIPLAFTNTALDIGEQFLKRSLASSTNAIVELASFAIAFKIFSLFSGAADEFKFCSMVLLKSSKDRKKMLIFAGCFTLIPFIFMVLLGVTPLGYYIIEKAHDVSKEVGDKSRTALLIFSIYPVFDSFAFVHIGVLIRYKYTFMCGVAAMSDVGTKILTVLLLAAYSNLSVMYIPLIASYVGLLARFIVVMVTYYKYANEKVCEDTGDEESGVKMITILKTYLPLLVARLIQRLSRPIVNLFVARDRRDGLTEKDSLEALAVLSVVYPIGHVPYGWLNELKSLESTFTKKSESGHSELTVRQVRFFGFLCFCLSATMMISFFWIPGIIQPLIIGVANVNADFANMCIVPIRFVSMCCIPVVFRDLTIGWLLKVKRTSGIYPGVICRLSIIIILVNIFPLLGFHKATMATTTLFIGFISESTFTLASALYVKRSRRIELQNIEKENLKLMSLEEDGNGNAFYETAL